MAKMDVIKSCSVDVDVYATFLAVFRAVSRGRKKTHGFEKKKKNVVFYGEKRSGSFGFQKKTSVEIFFCWMIWMKSYQKLP